MRAVPLTVLKGGINRLRTKGGARADTAYDIVNGYLTAAGTVRSRPGTVRAAALDSKTKGLASHGGELHTFAAESVSVPAGYRLHVLKNPNEQDTIIQLKKIHFAKPFLGYLYVIAEFEDGGVFHYWLQTGTPWEADRIYIEGELVEPTIPNGLAYRATRNADANPVWTPNTEYQQGDIVEPTVRNGLKYTAIDVSGSPARSGSVEPDWPTAEGGLIHEEADLSQTTQAPAGVPSDDSLTPDIEDRYGR